MTIIEILACVEYLVITAVFIIWILGGMESKKESKNIQKIDKIVQLIGAMEKGWENPRGKK